MPSEFDRKEKEEMVGKRLDKEPDFSKHSGFVRGNSQKIDPERDPNIKRFKRKPRTDLEITDPETHVAKDKRE